MCLHAAFRAAHRDRRLPDVEPFEVAEQEGLALAAGERGEHVLDAPEQFFAFERFVRPASRIDGGLERVGRGFLRIAARPKGHHGAPNFLAALKIGDAVAQDPVEERTPFVLGTPPVIPHQPDHRVLHGVLRFRAITKRHGGDAQRAAFDSCKEPVERALPVHRALPRFTRPAERQWRDERSRAIHRLVLHRLPTPRAAQGV